MSDAEPGHLITGEAVALDLLPTPWVLRAAGVAIDYLIYLAAYIGLIVALGSVAAGFGLEDAVTAALGVSFAVLAFIGAPTAVETLTRGRSVGKLAVGARIVRDDGGAIGFRHALIRSLVGLLEIVVTLGGTAAIVGFLNARSKRLGDFVAGTYSQRERVSRRPAPIVALPPALLPWSLTADVARMPQRLGRRIAQFLAQSAGLTPGSRARLAHELATEAAAYVSPLPDTDAESFLAAVVAMRRDREFRALTLEAERVRVLSPALTELPRGFPARD